ncbi:ABC transporter permease [Thermoproteota archaeon]
MGLRGYIVRRMFQLIPMIFGLLVINFTLIHMGGDPVYVLAGEDASPEYLEVVRERYGLNKPLHIQFIAYISNVLQGDLGTSWRWSEPVSKIIWERIPNTLLLVFTSQILGILMGIILSIITARIYPSKTEAIISGILLAFYSMPLFWFGVIMLIIFAFQLRWFPIGGIISIDKELTGTSYILDRLWHLFLPVFTMTVAWLMPMYQRITSASVIEVMNEDFITTARAKGMDEWSVFIKHALRNALLPTVTVAGMYFGLMFSGAILTETIFSWPGIGRLMFEATINRDFPVLMGIFLIVSITVLLATLLTDIVYAILDPRITYE